MKRTILYVSLFFVVSIILSGCALFRGISGPGPKLYDNATIVIVSNNILLPQTVDKDFLQITLARLGEFTKSEIEEKGSLVVIPECGQRTLKITQEITSIFMGSVSEMRTGFLPFQIFRGSATTTSSNDIAISTVTNVYDCENDKKLGTYYFTSNGPNPIDLLRYLAEVNVTYAYQHQHGSKF